LYAKEKKRKFQNNPDLLKGGRDSAADTPSHALLFSFLITTPKTYTFNQKKKIKKDQKKI
jgi:hypothetical protein